MQLRKSIVLLLMGCMFLSSAAFAAQDGDYTYTESGGNATVTDYTGAGGDITIPNTLGTYPTVAIGDYAFGYSDSTNETTLTSVIIPISVTTIGVGAFRRCINVTSVTIPEGVETIADFAFARMYALTSVSIPASVTSIGTYAFFGGTSNAGITVAPANLDYSSSVDGVLYNKTKSTLIQYPCGNTQTAFTTPASVTSIGIAAFELCDYLTSVTFTSGVASIADSAFGYCPNLDRAYFEGNAPTMGRYVFDTTVSGFRICYTGTGFTTPTWEPNLEYGIYPAFPIADCEPATTTTTTVEPTTTTTTVEPTTTTTTVEPTTTTTTVEPTTTTTTTSLLTLTAPNGGESWQRNSMKNITWSTSGSLGNLKITLWQNDVLIGTIAQDVDPSLGSYRWSTGAYTGVVAPLGTGYKIKIKEQGTSVSDVSDAPFSIVKISVKAPNGGENWQIGSTQNITWVANSISGELRIVLFKDGVKVGNIVNSIDPALGTYSWTVGQLVGGTATAGTGYQVQMREIGTDAGDRSNTNFTLTAP